MDDLAPPSIGRQVAKFRKLRGLTQSGLAARLHRSESWVTKVERGERRIDSVSVLAQLSRALAVPVYQLTGHFEAPPGDSGPALPAGLTELRRTLARPALTSSTGEPRPMAELEREVAALARVYHTATYHVSAVMPRLVDPIRQAQAAARAGPEAQRPRAYSALAELYLLAAHVLAHSGDLPRALIASDRAMAAAEQSADLLRIGAVAAFHAMRLGMGGDGADGVAVAVDVADLVLRDPRAQSPDGAVVLGALYGYGVAAAVAAEDATEARRLLKAAGEYSERLGRDREAYGAHFGPANLATKEVAVLASSGRPDQAIEAAGRVPVGQLGSRARIGIHCTWLAVAHTMCGDDDRALSVLETGLEATPEVVRHLFKARDLVHDMLHRCRSVDERLRRIAREMNLPR